MEAQPEPHRVSAPFAPQGSSERGRKAENSQEQEKPIQQIVNHFAMDSSLPPFKIFSGTKSRYMAEEICK